MNTTISREPGLAASSADVGPSVRQSMLAGALRRLLNLFRPPPPQPPPKKKRARGFRMGHRQVVVWTVLGADALSLRAIDYDLQNLEIKAVSLEALAAATGYHAVDLRRQLKHDINVGFVEAHEDGFRLTSAGLELLAAHRARKAPPPPPVPDAAEHPLAQPVEPALSIGDGPGEIDLAGAGKVTIKPIFDEPVTFPRRTA